MRYNFDIVITILVIVLLVITLYRDWLRPSMAFILAVFGLIVVRIITVDDLLSGLANKQIIVIFLLIILTSGVQRNIGKEFFFRVFRKDLTPFQFRFRMMAMVSGLSSVLNNTPVVAFMIPFVKNWAESNNYSVSKFLIPMSFATILGGMITVVGTSTNLVLNGLISQAGLPLLGYQDFLYLGLLITVFGIAYLTLFSHKLLPDRLGNKEEVIGQLNEYLVETLILPSSTLIGKSIEDAGLRHLKELFLVEIKRGPEVISAVNSNEKLQANDILFFAGNTGSILNLINEKNGLSLPESSHIETKGFSALSEAIVPSGSNLIGQNLKQANFRDRFKASVISVYRKGEKVRGNLGEIPLQPGDLLLMLSSGGNTASGNNFRDLILLSKRGDLESAPTLKKVMPSILAIGVLILGIVGIIDLFLAAFLGILCMVVLKVLPLAQVKKAVDIDLLVILVSALAVGIAIQKSGTAAFLVAGIEQVTAGGSPLINIALLFFITLGLTSLITNAAAVSIMFPIAYEMALREGGNLTPFFVAIAFAASADFMTPIGYQTNLMVMGPGNYKFADYTRIGLPLTVIYTVITLSFIHYYYL
jgi:di/tricarboxylate transporter